MANQSQHLDGVLICVLANQTTAAKTGAAYFESKSEFFDSKEMEKLNLCIGISATTIVNAGSRSS